MAEFTPINRSFNAGLLTDLVAERSDLDKYHSGCSVLENMIVTPYGPVQKMPGSYFVAKAKNAAARVIPFQYSAADALILEVGPGYIRFFKNGRPVYLNGTVTTWAANTQYAIADIIHDSSTGAPWVCVAAHVSSAAFADDAANWYQQENLLDVVCNDTVEGTTESGCVRIWCSVTDPDYWFAFSQVKPGDYIYCRFSGTFTDGFYRVLGVDPQFNRWVDIDLTYQAGVVHVTVCSPVIYEIPIPPQAVVNIHHGQSNDVVFMAHPNHPTSKLMRFSGYHWEWRPLDLKDGPFLTQELMDSIDDCYICPSGANTARILKAGSFRSYGVGQVVEVDYSEGLGGVLVSEKKTVTAIDATLRNYVDVAATGFQAALGSAGSTLITGVAASNNGSGFLRLTKSGIGEGVSAGDTFRFTKKDTSETVTAGIFTGSWREEFNGNERVGVVWTDTDFDGFVVGDWLHVTFAKFPRYNGLYQIKGVVLGTNKRINLDFAWPRDNFGYPVDGAHPEGGWLYGERATYPIEITIRYPYYLTLCRVTDVEPTHPTHTWIDLDMPYRGPTTWASGENLHTATHIVSSNYLEMLDAGLAISSDGGGSPKIRITYTNLQNEYRVGSYLYFNFSETTYADGWYAITARNTTNKTFDINLTYSTAVPTVEVYKSRITADIKCPMSILPSGTTGTISLDTSDDAFDSRDVGRLIAIDQYRPAAGGNISFDGPTAVTTTSDPLMIVGSWEVTTKSTGTFAWTLTLERKKDAWSPWEAVRTWSRDGANILDSGEELEASAYYRLISTAVTGSHCLATLSSRGNKIRGVVKVTEFVSTTRVNAKVLRNLYEAAATTYWRFGKYSARSGYPSTLTFHNDRLNLAGCQATPNEIDRSRVGDYENFQEGTNADDAQIIPINTATNDAIQWIIGHGGLYVGTAGGEHSFAGANGEPMTMENIRPGKPTYFGSKDIQPVLVGDSVLFVQGEGKNIREIVYSLETDSDVAVDLSELAPQVVESGILDIAYMQTPYPTLWCVMGDGSLAGLTRNRMQNVAAWHVHTTTGDYKSVAVIKYKNKDELWAIVERAVGTCIERFGSFTISDDIGDQFFVHCGIRLDYGDAVDCGVEVTDHYVKISPDSLPISSDGVVMMADQGCWIALRGLPTGLADLDFDQSGNIWQLGDVDGTGYRLNQQSTNPEGAEYDPDHSLTTGVVAGTITMQWVTPIAPNRAGLTRRTDLIDGDHTSEIDCSGVNYFTLSKAGNVVVAGLPYAAKVAPMPFNLDYSGGTIRNKQKRVNALAASLFRSGVCKVGYDLTKMEDTKIDDDELFTGMKGKPIGGTFTKDPVFYVVSDEPRQLVVRAIVPQFEIGED